MKRTKTDSIEEIGPLPDLSTEYEPITKSSLVKQLSKLEKLIVLNHEQRRDYPKNPEKFLQSESDLNDLLDWFIQIGTADSDVLLALASSNENDSLFGFYSTLIPLLEHPNTDIGNAVVKIINEIFFDDGEVIAENDLEIYSLLAQRCIKADLVHYFVTHSKNLRKNNEDDPDDNQAIFEMFSVIDNILDLFHYNERNESGLIDLYGSLKSSEFILFLIEMFKQDPKVVKNESFSSKLSIKDYENRLFAAELCSTIFQLSAYDLKQQEATALSFIVSNLWNSSMAIIDALLISISVYKNRDPIDSNEQEYLFNLFDCLAVLLLNSSEARKTFNSEKCEGIQLFLLLLKEVNIARIRAIQIIDYALAPEDTSDLVTNFINLGGLKVISPILMGKGTLKLAKTYPKLLLSTDQDESRVCAIVSSLFKNVPVNSTAYFRLITKFVENSGEKFIKLIELHQKYSERVSNFDEEHQLDNDKEEWLLDRINAGLFVLQQIDICLLILTNSLQVLQLIGNNQDAQLEIEKELFDTVWDEAEKTFKLDETILTQVKRNVKEFIDELDDKSTISIVPLLKTFQ